jgi:hypothetical protein
MSGRGAMDRSRRGFLVGALAMIATPPAIMAGQVEARDNRPPTQACLETILRVLCPADRRTPDGVDCGLAEALSRVVMACPEQERMRFESGLMEVAREWRRNGRDGRATASPRWVGDLFAGRTSGGDQLADWAHNTMLPLVLRACMSEQVYDSYDNRVFWKVFSLAGEASI